MIDQCILCFICFTIDWQYLSYNVNAISILENNLDKVDWQYLSCNANAISDFLKKHLLKKDSGDVITNEITSIIECLEHVMHEDASILHHC